jgi:cobalt/nickel transport system permease protein
MALTTPWPALLKALRFFRVPALLVVIFAMATRFIFVLLEIARDAFEARRARHVGHLPLALQRRMAVSSAGMLLAKSMSLSGEVYEAMLARGFRGEAVTLAEFRMNRADWAAAALFAALALAALEWGCRS